MPRLNAANNARTVLSGAITSDATSFTVADAAVFPDPPFRVTVENEIMEIGAKDDLLNTFASVQRGLEGTAATGHPDGAAVENRLTAGAYGELSTEAALTAHLADTATLADMGHVKHGTLTATLTTTWDGSEAPYTQEVTVNGIIATDNPIIDIVLTGTYETDSAIENAWANVYRIITAAGKITAYAHAVPEVEIPLQLKVVR